MDRATSETGDRDETVDEPTAGHGAAIREDGPAARAGSEFDPTPYLRQLRGRGGSGEYLDVKWRLLWLRREHPDAEILTDLVKIEPTLAIFKATVTLPTGGKATGYGSETAGDFGDFIEKAETKAIGRALNALGYGAHFSENGEDVSVPAPIPARREPTPAPRPSAEQRTASRPGPAAPARREPAPAPARAAAPEAADAPARTARAERPAQSAPPPAPIELNASRGDRSAARQNPAETDAELTTYSWTAFWPWAREQGFTDLRAVEQFIGRAKGGLSPAELRDLIVERQNAGPLPVVDAADADDDGDAPF